MINYFFVFILQPILPIAILLGCNWSRFTNFNIRVLLWLGLLSFIAGILLQLNLPTDQLTSLIFNTIILGAIILFYISQFFPSRKLAYFWHYILLIIAGIGWGKNPNISMLTNTDVINTDFILNTGAVIVGILFCLIVAAWLRILLRQLQAKTTQKLTALSGILSSAITLLLITPILSDILLTLMKRHVLDLTKARLSFVAKVSNIQNYSTYFICLLILFSCFCFFMQVHLVRKQQQQTETHPIEKRKKTALVQQSRRTLLIGGFALAVAYSTRLYWDKIASQPPQLSESLPVTPNSQGDIIIPIEQVKDGKLHRFVWVASDGKAVRFFVINRSSKKLSLAVVFDACLLCGDQGYVMEGDQVICVGCGVRIFIPSIGKPGGCNPVPIENWHQTQEHIIIPRKSLEDGVNYFSTIVELDVIDPVDHSQLKNTTTEYKYRHEGQTYFFKNEQNLNLFRDHPEHYLSPLSSNTEVR